MQYAVKQREVEFRVLDKTTPPLNKKCSYDGGEVPSISHLPGRRLGQDRPPGTQLTELKTSKETRRKQQHK